MAYALTPAAAAQLALVGRQAAQFARLRLSDPSAMEDRPDA